MTRLTDRLDELWIAYTTPGKLPRVRELWTRLRPSIPTQASTCIKDIDNGLADASTRSSIDQRHIRKLIVTLRIWLEGWEAGRACGGAS